MEKYYGIPEKNSLDSMEGIQPETEIEERFKIHPEILSRLSQEDREKVDGSLLKNITPVEEIIPGANVENLPTFENNIGSSEKVPGRSDPIYTPYSDYAIELVSKLDKETLEKIRESFKDKVIVDIGAGRFSKGYDLACYLNAKGYIAVEPFNDSYLFEFMLNQKDKKGRKIKSSTSFKKDTITESIPLNIVAEDGVSFLKRLPDNSAVVFTFGIEEGAVICDEQYIQKLKDEASRVSIREGYILTANSLVYMPKGTVAREIFASRDIQEGTSIRKIEQGISEKNKVEWKWLE